MPSLIEALEPRILFNAAAGDVWVIRGDLDRSDVADVIVIDQPDPVDDPDLVTATINGTVVDTRRASDLRLIKVIAGKGDDVVHVDLLHSDCPIPVKILGGRGDDELYGGYGADRLSGGSGDDMLDAGDGDDRLRGGSGDDMLDAGDGDDRLRGGGGVDELHGGLGTDTMAGGGGIDMIFGQPDVDIVRGGRRDQLFGDGHSNPIQQLGSDQELRDWLVDQAVSRWGHLFGQSDSSSFKRFELPWIEEIVEPVPGGAIDIAVARMSEDDASSVSQTNNQVEGVDEPDLVKTDGQFIYTLSQGQLIIVDALPVDDLSVVGSVDLDGFPQQMFLSGDRLTVLSQIYSNFNPWPWPDEGIFRPAADQHFVRLQPQVDVTVYDVSDRSDPHMVEQATLDGRLVDARAIDEQVFIILNNSFSLPSPILVTDGQGGSVYEDVQLYVERLTEMDLSDLLPGYVATVDDVDTQGLLVSAPNLFVPDIPNAQQMLSLVKFDVSDDVAGPDESTSAVGITGDVYATTENLYIAAQSFWHPATAWSWDPTTHLYRFALDEPGLPLEATGAVPGWILNQFSMDEHDGFLRVATTDRNSSNFSEPFNNIFVLEESDSQLTIVGSVTGLAETETIHSARFLGDRGYVVTFRRVDPLFAIDLSDPFDPQVKGQLKIPGFSSYLQPVGENLLLGIGRMADDRGVAQGLQFSLFDVTDMGNPLRIDVETFGKDLGFTNSEAEFNHHAVSFFPDQSIVALPVSEGIWPDRESNLKVYHLDELNGIELLGQIEHDGEQIRRSLRFDGFIYSLSRETLKVSELANPEVEVAVLDLFEDDSTST